MKDEPRRYATAAAFRVALEARLKTMEQAEGIDLQRLRRQVSFDRLLARLFSEQNAPWLLKGGYAMELRLRTARTTKDIDLSLPTDAASEWKGRVLEHLQTHAARDLKDFFVFAIGQPMMDLTAAPEGGARYPVSASLAGRVFTRFHLDVGMGMPPFSPQSYWKGETGWVLRESIRQNLWRFPKNSSLRKNCTPTPSRVLRERTLASRMSSIWRFCFGSEHWIGNGSGKPLIRLLLCETRTCFQSFCRNRLHHGMHLIRRWRQNAASPGRCKRPFRISGGCSQMKYRNRRE